MFYTLFIISLFLFFVVCQLTFLKLNHMMRILHQEKYCCSSFVKYCIKLMSGKKSIFYQYSSLSH